MTLPTVPPTGVNPQADDNAARAYLEACYPRCRASGQHVHTDNVDHGKFARCPVCQQKIITRPSDVLGGADWRYIVKHRARHLPGCHVGAGIACSCGLGTSTNGTAA